MRNVLGNNQKQQPVLQRLAEAQKPSSIFSLRASRMSGCVGGDVQGQPPLCDLVDGAGEVLAMRTGLICVLPRARQEQQPSPLYKIS